MEFFDDDPGTLAKVPSFVITVPIIQNSTHLGVIIQS